jgi:hypothetical protein
MRLGNFWLIAAFCEITYSVAWGALGGPIAPPILAEASDVVAVARLDQVNSAASPAAISLQVVRVLKGQPTSLLLLATLPQGSQPTSAFLAGIQRNATGVWFLKMGTVGYTLMPLARGFYTSRDMFLPISDLQGAEPTGTIAHQLVSYELRSYESLATPNTTDDERLFASLIYNDGRDSSDLITSLANSAVPKRHAIGLAAEVRLGSPSAVTQVANELNVLSSNPGFGYILSSLSSFFPVQDPAAVEAFTELVNLHSSVAGIDAAASTALMNIGNGAHLLRSTLPAKSVLPAMVTLLDSHDTSAQMRAVRFLAYFTMFADAAGNVPGTGVTGPFATVDTKQFTPSNASMLTAPQYAAFWKVWWAENHANLGL